MIRFGDNDRCKSGVIKVIDDDNDHDYKTQAFEMASTKLLVSDHGNYYKMGDRIGKFGWSFQKNKDK